MKFEKRCPLVIHERSPRERHTGQPDVLGITNDRYMLEIEIKRTVSDFRANFNKEHMRNRCCDVPEIRDAYLKRGPRQFWFLVPEKIRVKIQEQVPDWAGLLIYDPNQGGWGHIQCVKKSPTNQLSEKLSLKDCARLLRNVGNQMYSLMHARHNMIAAGYHIDPHGMDEFHSQKLEWNGERHVWVPNYDYLNFQI